jgi:hypothetical protein
MPRPGRYLRPAAAAVVLLLLVWPVSASWGRASRLVAGTRDQLILPPPTPAPVRAAPPLAPAAPEATDVPMAPAAPAAVSLAGPGAPAPAGGAGQAAGSLPAE